MATGWLSVPCPCLSRLGDPRPDPAHDAHWQVRLVPATDQLDAANPIFDTLLQSLTFFAPATD